MAAAAEVAMVALLATLNSLPAGAAQKAFMESDPWVNSQKAKALVGVAQNGCVCPKCGAGFAFKFAQGTRALRGIGCCHACPHRVG